MSSAEMRAPLAASPSQDRGGSAPQSQRACLRLSPLLNDRTCRWEVGRLNQSERASAQILAGRFKPGACRVFGSVLSCMHATPFKLNCFCKIYPIALKVPETKIIHSIIYTSSLHTSEHSVNLPFLPCLYTSPPSPRSVTTPSRRR